MSLISVQSGTKKQIVRSYALGIGFLFTLIIVSVLVVTLYNYFFPINTASVTSSSTVALLFTIFMILGIGFLFYLKSTSQSMKMLLVILPRLVYSSPEISMNKFEENLKKIDTLGDEYQGNFVAVYKQEVVGVDTDFKNLINKIINLLNEKELYMSYIPKKNEKYSI